MSLEGAKLICLNEDGHPIQTIIAKGRKFTIGYYMNCDYVLSDAKAEGVHCEIECDAFGRVFICNLSTNNPITLNDNIVDVTRPLMHGSKLNILEKHFLWHFPRTISSECEQLTINESNCTPTRHIDRPKQPPISCPEIKMYRGVFKRLTIHTFAHTIKSDEMGNTSFKMESQDAEKDAEGEEEEIKSVDTQPVPENVKITPKAHLINSTKNKQNLSTEKKKQLLKLCHPSDMLITSYSPRETGVRIHKTFTSLVKPKVLVTKEHNKLGTPKIKYINDGDQSKNLISWYTPSSTAVKSAINTPLTVSQNDNNSSMHLIDLTITPQKIQTVKSAIKSSTKKKLIQDNTTIKEKSLGLSAIPDSPVCDEGSNISNTNNSIISISSTDSSSIISNASTRGQSPTKVQDKNFKINTPKQASSSLRKRALLSSVKKQATTQCTTPTGKDSPKRLQMRQNITTTPKSLTVTPKDAKLPVRRSTSTPTRKIINKDRLDFIKSSPSTSSAVKASPYNRFAATSTPYAVKVESSKQQKSPIHRVMRKSLKATPTNSRISKSQVASQFKEFSSLKEKSPQAVLSKRLVKRALKSLSGRSSNSNVSTKSANQSNCTEDGSNELSRTFVVESEESDVNGVEQKPRDATFSPNKRDSQNIACAPETNTNEADIVEKDECFDEIIEAPKEMISNEELMGNELEKDIAAKEKHDVTPKLIDLTETIFEVNLTKPATDLKIANNSEILQNQENKITAKLDDQTIFGEESISETSTAATSVMEKNLEIVSTEESKNMQKLDDNQVFGSELTTEENNRIESAANMKADKTNISHDDVNKCAIETVQSEHEIENINEPKHETCSLHFNVQELDEIEDILQPTTDVDGGSTENGFNIQNENVQVDEKAEEEPLSIKEVNVKPEEGSRVKQNEENPQIKVSEKDIEEENEEKEVKVDWQDVEETTKYDPQEGHEKEDKFKTKKSFQTNEIIAPSKQQTVQEGTDLIKAELCGQKSTSQNATMDTKLENKMSTIKRTIPEQKCESDENLIHTATKKIVSALKYEQKQEELKENPTTNTPKATVEESPTDEIKAIGHEKCCTEIEDTSKLLKEIEILLNKSDEMEQKRLEDNNGCHLTEENEKRLLGSQESDKAQQSSTTEHLNQNQSSKDQIIEDAQSAREVLQFEDQAKVGELMKEENVISVTRKNQAKYHIKDNSNKNPTEESPETLELASICKQNKEINDNTLKNHKHVQIPEEKSKMKSVEGKKKPEEGSISEGSTEELQIPEEKSITEREEPKETSEETSTSKQIREEKSMKGSEPVKQKPEETPTSDYEAEDGQHSNPNDKNNSEDLKSNKEFENVETIDDSAVEFSNEVKYNSVNNEENESLPESKMQSKGMETLSLDLTAKKFPDEEGKVKTEDNRNNTNVVAEETTPATPIRSEYNFEEHSSDKKQNELKTSTTESATEPDCIATQVEKVEHSVAEKEKLLEKAYEIEFHQTTTENRLNPSSAILGLTTSTPMTQKTAESIPLTGSKQASTSKGIKSCNFVTSLGDASPYTLRRSARRASASADTCEVRTSTQKVKRRASVTVSVNTSSKNTSDASASKISSKRLDFSEMNDGTMGTINEEKAKNEDAKEEQTVSPNTPTSAETKLEQVVWNTEDNKSVNNVSNINTQTPGASILKEQLLSATPKRRSRRTSVSTDYCYVCTPTTKVTRRSSFTESIHTTPKPSKILSGNVKDTKTPNSSSNAAASTEPYTPITPRRSARRASASAESCSAYTSAHKISRRSSFTASMETPTKGSHIKDLSKISRTQTPSKRLDFSVMKEIDEDMGAIIEEENENQEAPEEQSSSAKVPAQAVVLSHNLNIEDELVSQSSCECNVVTLEGKDEALAETHFSEMSAHENDVMVENKPTMSESNVVLNVEEEPVKENMIIAEHIESSARDAFIEKATTQPVVTEHVVVEEDSICEVVNETVAVLKETCTKPSEEDTNDLVNEEMDDIAEEFDHSGNEFDNDDVPVEEAQTLLTSKKAEVWDKCEYEYGQEIEDNRNFESNKLNFTAKQAVQSDNIEKDSTTNTSEDCNDKQNLPVGVQSDKIEKASSTISLEDVECQTNTEKDFELPTTSKQARILELEMLETPSSCKPNLDDDTQELLQTPKWHNMSKAIDNDPIINSPAENVEIKDENWDKYLKTPRAKNIMIPSIEKGSDVKIVPTPTPTTEYNLNITNDTESIHLEELFKTPGMLRLIEPNSTSTPCFEVKENIIEDKKIIKDSVKDNEISAEDEEEVLKLNKSAEEAFDELMGESVNLKSQIRKTYDRKMSSLKTPIVPSPFSAAHVVSDLPKSDVEEWIERLETEEDSVMMSNEYKQDQEDETEELVNAVDSTNKSTIQPPASCFKMFFKDNTSVMNTTSSSDVIINLSSPKESSIKDPLRDSLINNRNKKPTQYSTNANEAADMSGLQLLDQTEESIFEAPLMVSDDDDSAADKNLNIKSIKSPLKVTKLIDNSNESSNDLAEPLIVSESEDLNLSQSEEDIAALPLEESKSNLEDSDSLTFIDNDNVSNIKMEVNSNTLKANETQALENEEDLTTERINNDIENDLNININKEQTGNVSLSTPGEVTDSEKADTTAAVTTLSKDQHEQEIEVGEENSAQKCDNRSNVEHVDTCGTDQSDDVSIVETGTSDATDENSFKRQINVKECDSHLEYKKAPSEAREKIQAEQSSHPTATLHDTATRSSDICKSLELSNAEKITVEDIAINMVSKSPEAEQSEKNKTRTNEISKPNEFSEQEVVKEANKEEMAEEFKLEKFINQEDIHKVEFVDEKHMLHKPVTPHKTEKTAVLDIREHVTPPGVIKESTNNTQPEECPTEVNVVSTSVNEEKLTEANFIIQERHKSSVAEETVKTDATASNITCEPVDYSKAVLSVEEEKTNVQKTFQEEEEEKEKSTHNQRDTNDIYKVQQIEDLEVEATTFEVHEAINLSSRKNENKIEEEVTNLWQTNEAFKELKPTSEVKCRQTESLKADTENVEIIDSLEVYEKRERKDTSPVIKETIESGKDMSGNSEEASTSIKQTVTKQSFKNYATQVGIEESMQKKMDINIRNSIIRSDMEIENQTMVKENEETDNDDVVYVEQKDEIIKNPGTDLATTNDRTEKPLLSGADNIITISDEEIEAITAEAHVTNEVFSPAAGQQKTDLATTETKESPENNTTTAKTYNYEITISDSTKSTSESSTSHIDENREQSKVRTRKTRKAFQASEDSNSNIDIPLTRFGRKRLQQNIASVEASKSEPGVKRTRRKIAKSESSQDSVQDKEDKEAGTTKRNLRKKLTKKSPLKTIEEQEASQKRTSPGVNEPPHITAMDLSNIKTVQVVKSPAKSSSEGETKMLTSELPQDLSNPLNLVTHKSEILHSPAKPTSIYIPTVRKEESPSSSYTTRQFSNLSIEQQFAKKEPINLTFSQAGVNSHQESESRQQEEQKPLKKRARQLQDQDQGSLESKPDVISQTMTFQEPVHDLEDVVKTKDPTPTKTKLIASSDTSSINIAPLQLLNSESIELKENAQLSSAPVVLNNSTPPDNSIHRSDEQIAEGSSKRARGTRKRLLHKIESDTEKPRRGTRRKQNLIDQTTVTEPNVFQTSENQKLEELNQPEPQMSPVKSSRGRRKRAKQVDNDDNSSVTASTSKRRANRRKAEERILHEQEMKEVIQKLEKLEPTSGESEKDLNKSDVGNERVSQEKEPTPISVQIFNKKELFPEDANAVQSPTYLPPENISTIENREELQINDKKKPLKKKGRKRKDDSGDTLDANTSQEEPSRKRAAPGVENQGHNVEVLPKPTDNLEGTPLNVERNADPPVSQSRRPQRKAATAYHNYDETSDSEMAPAKKNPDAHRKRIDVEKSPVPTAIESSLQMSPTQTGIVTTRGRMRKPNARVQQFLEEERAKGDTPKKRLASSTPQRTPGGRGRKASTSESLTTDNVQETPKAAKRGRGRILAQLEHEPIEEIEKPLSVPTTQPEDKEITTLPVITEVLKESLKSDEIGHSPAITKPRRGRKAKILNETEEPTQKKSPGAPQMEKLELTPASATTPTRIAGRRTAAAAAKARIEEDAIAAAAIDPPKKVRSRKVAAKVTPIENDEPSKLPSTVTEIEPPKMDHRTASTENLAVDLVVEAKEPESMEITQPTKRGARKAAAINPVTSTVMPPKRGRRAKAAVVDYGEHETDDTEVKARTIRNRKIVHFESAGKSTEQSEETPSGTVGSSISTETAQSKVTPLTEEANAQQTQTSTQTTATKRVTRARRK